MDLSTPSGLAAAVASFLNRDDLSAQVPAFIRLAESRFNRELRVREMVKRAYTETVPGENRFRLPTDFVEAKALRISAPCQYAGDVEYGAPDDMADRAAHRIGPDEEAPWAYGYLKRWRAGASPLKYGLDGFEMYLAPHPKVSVKVELTYYGAVPALDVSTATPTWLLTKAPDLYLYASLIASAPFLVEDERLTTWGTLASDALASLNTESERAATSGSRLVAKRRTFG